VSELPEVEVMSNALSRELIGRKFKLVTITGTKHVPRHKTTKDFRNALEGMSIKSVDRLGRNLIFLLDNQTSLVIDTGKTGFLQRAVSAKDAKPKHLAVTFGFTQGQDLRFIDVDGSAELYVSTPRKEGAEVEISKFARLSVGGGGLGIRKTVSELAPLGIDPFEDQIGWDRFAAVLRSRSTPLRAVLTDDSIICGVGPMYADEILFVAALRGDREADSLSTIEIRRLHRAIAEVLAEAVKQGGTSLGAEGFVDPDGKLGGYQNELAVFNREGENCPQCRTAIETMQVEGATTYFCPKCQA
jgi:formamidopyrimidine-DNA glycosylase